MAESLAFLDIACLRYVPALMMAWLALLFARTLRAGEVPLIECIARRGKPVLSATLCRYTRRLTALWCAYFVVASGITLTAAVALTAHSGVQPFGLGVAAASTLLFVGEYWVRLRLFPGESFPGLVQQVRDTVSVWRPRREA